MFICSYRILIIVFHCVYCTHAYYFQVNRALSNWFQMLGAIASNSSWNHEMCWICTKITASMLNKMAEQCRFFSPALPILIWLAVANLRSHIHYMCVHMFFSFSIWIFTWIENCFSCMQNTHSSNHRLCIKWRKKIHQQRHILYSTYINRIWAQTIFWQWGEHTETTNSKTHSHKRVYGSVCEWVSRKKKRLAWKTRSSHIMTTCTHTPIQILRCANALFQT